jgi:hypothetical protein
MVVSVHWVKAPYGTRGLDHLGSQAPCINAYGQLLPGLTNVTDRIRYYSFYPWFLREVDKRHSALGESDFVELLRRAECLFALVGLRHALVTGEEHHRAGLVGYNTLAPLMEGLNSGGAVRLSTHTTHADLSERYFKNRYGGLAQYYFVTLRELGILAGDQRSGLKYVKGIGEELASGFGEGLDEHLFFETLTRDEVTAELLDGLSGTCPCGLQSNEAERSVLQDLFLDPERRHGSDGKTRRGTLGLFLGIAHELSEQGESPEPLEEWAFRSICYSETLPNGSPFPPMPGCSGSLRGWRIYVTNELLSLAIQAIFWALLDRLLFEGGRVNDLSDLEGWFRETLGRRAIGSDADTRLVDYVEERRRRIPELGDWRAEGHEIALTRELEELVRTGKESHRHEQCLKSAIDVLVILAARWGEDQKGYAPLAFPAGYFESYPVNLLNFFGRLQAQWRDYSLLDLATFMVLEWGVRNHLMVAFRKLRYQTTDTFRIKPTDEGFVVSDEPPLPVFTNPRFRQGRQALMDLGLLNRSATGLTGRGEDALLTYG